MKKRNKSASQPAGSNGPYKVGRGKPPASHQFKKGQSGNPTGVAKQSRRKTYSSADMAVRSLKKPVAGRKGNEIVTMEAIEAIYQKRTELALKGDKWAIKECCEDARRYGLLQDPRITSLSRILSPEDINNSSDAELEYLVRILSRRESAGEQVHENTPPNGPPKLFSVGQDNGAGYTIKRDLTVDQAVVIVDSLKAKQVGFIIQDENDNVITEHQLRASY